MNDEELEDLMYRAGLTAQGCWDSMDQYAREAIMDFAALVAAEKDKEIELLRADAKRLDWCISVLHRQDEKYSYLVTDAGCGCCGEGKTFVCSISGRDAIDAAIRTRGEI